MLQSLQGLCSSLCRCRRGCSQPQCGKKQREGLTPKRKLRPVSPMTDEITGDRNQTCKKMK